MKNYSICYIKNFISSAFTLATTSIASQQHQTGYVIFEMANAHIYSTLLLAMEYRDTLLQYIMQGQQEEMATWIKSHPHLERLQIMNEFKELMEDLAKEKGMDMDDDLDEFEDAITNYQEKILDEQLASLKQDMVEKDLEVKMDEMGDMLNNVRKNLIESILSNPPNVAELRKMADDIMQIEKDNDVFDPQNWKGIL